MNRIFSGFTNVERAASAQTSGARAGFLKWTLLAVLLAGAGERGARAATIVDNFGNSAVWKSGLSQKGKMALSGGRMDYTSSSTLSGTGGAAMLRTTPLLTLTNNWSLKVNAHLYPTPLTRDGQFSDVFLGIGPTANFINTHVTLEFGHGRWGDDGGYYVGDDVRIGGKDAQEVFGHTVSSSDVALRMDYTASDHTLTYYYNPDTNAAAQGLNWVLGGSIDLVSGDYNLGLKAKDTISIALIGSSGYQNVTAGEACLTRLEITTDAPDTSTHVSVATVGGGTVTPDLNDTPLTVGKSYKLTAKPAGGYVFAGWAGSLESSQSVLSFVARTNMSLTANFIPNPFTRIGGSYQGLCLDTANVAADKAGPVTMTLTTNGAYTGKVVLAGKSFSISGAMDTNGFASNSVAQTKTNNLLVTWQVDLAGDTLTGTIVGAGWSSPLTAVRAAYSAKTPWTNAGAFTLVIPGSDDSQHQPGGDGVGAVTVKAAGAAALSATLADGTAATSSAGVSAGGRWPVFASLYSGKGLILGWLNFTNEAGSDLRGDLHWVKQPQKAAYYADGFSTLSEALGSAYSFAGGQVAGLSVGKVWLAQGNLASAYTNWITVTNNKVFSTNKLFKMTFTTSTGLFSGSVPNPEGAKLKALSFKGAVLQKQTNGFGFFLGTNQSGRVMLERKPLD
jgi:hypothetical protein